MDDRQQYIVALEIGTTAVKLAAATAAPRQPLTIVSMASQPLASGVRYGRIQNVEDVTGATMLALQNLAADPAVAPNRITGVYVGIGGRSLGTIRASANLTLPEESEITPDIIERLKEDALAAVPQNREALEIIPLAYTVDGVDAQRPAGSVGTRVAGTFTIVVCDPVNSRNIDRVVVKKLNLDICGYIVRPLAVANLALTTDDTNPGCMLVDIGAETTTVSIFKNAALHYIATIPMGSRNITRDLADGLGIVESKAEEIKTRLGNAMPDTAAETDDPTIPVINSHVQARATEIAANIVAHIGFAGMGGADLRAGIIVTGRGAKLRGMCQLLKDMAQLPVRTAMIPQTLRIADPAVNPADSTDIIAIAATARRRAAEPDAIPCVEEAQPQAQNQTQTAPQGFEHGTFGNGGDNGTDFVDAGRGDTGDDVLLDSDEEERRRTQREEKERLRAARERKKAEEKARRQNVNKNSGIFAPGKIFSGLTGRIRDLINDDGNGNELSDD